MQTATIVFSNMKRSNSGCNVLAHVDINGHYRKSDRRQYITESGVPHYEDYLKKILQDFVGDAGKVENVSILNKIRSNDFYYYDSVVIAEYEVSE